MILAEEFSRSQIARIADFSTSRYERGVYWMRERSRKRRKLEDEDDDSAARDQAFFSDLAARPLPCADRIDATYGRLPATVQPPGKDYVLTRGILLAQFASPNGKALADAVELISAPVKDPQGDNLRLVDGIDLNCVCALADTRWLQLTFPRRAVPNLGHMPAVRRRASGCSGACPSLTPFVSSLQALAAGCCVNQKL